MEERAVHLHPVRRDIQGNQHLEDEGTAWVEDTQHHDQAQCRTPGEVVES